MGGTSIISKSYKISGNLCASIHRVKWAQTFKLEDALQPNEVCSSLVNEPNKTETILMKKFQTTTILIRALAAL